MWWKAPLTRYHFSLDTRASPIQDDDALAEPEHCTANTVPLVEQGLHIQRFLKEAVRTSSNVEHLLSDTPDRHELMLTLLARLSRLASNVLSFCAISRCWLRSDTTT